MAEDAKAENNKSVAQTEKPLLAAVMLKGTVNVTTNSMKTLSALRLLNVNNCVVVPGDDTKKGMLRTIQKYITWGEISRDVLKMLLEKKGGMESKKAKATAEKAFRAGMLEGNLVFRLSPPTGGLNSVRLPYPKGDSGYRGEDINNLLKRMI